ncbi:NAD(P)/FAD-dependent oxidoreductase [Methylocapsa palsarum]|uniref:L-2-hydroxyglutarate oxidase LhgO n=1 Tax=Methylocapsa palsarum TaxID=1612308 RepID=A0A1I3YQ20_9HYPH|nr:L-2-hydroxyglutarate oxidase LhgO [Methylocapsa palsarum]
MNEVPDVECIVIGAGVIGLAAARSLAQSGRETVLLEAGRAIGTGISSRNSGVIHAGIYYPRNSLKARFCVEGRKKLYDYCETRQIPHRRCGKIVVAPLQSQRAQLMAIEAQARINGVDDLIVLEGDALRDLEPELKGEIGLLSPSTGLIDAHALMLSLQGDFEASGGAIAFGSPVVGGAAAPGRIIVFTGGAEPTALSARHVIVAAGLSTPAVAAAFNGIAPLSIPKQHAAKGNYFALQGRAPFSRLIYPMPEPGGLGTHLTLDLDGRARFGPDVEWLDLKSGASPDYSVDPSRAAKFYASIRAYWPGLNDGALAPDYAGVRPKLSGPGQPPADFLIQDETLHGAPGLILLYGIESPGLTSCLAIAHYIAEAVSGHSAQAER